MPFSGLKWDRKCQLLDASTFHPIHTTHIYGHKVHPYIQAVFKPQKWEMEVATQNQAWDMTSLTSGCTALVSNAFLLPTITALYILCEQFVFILQNCVENCQEVSNICSRPRLCTRWHVHQSIKLLQTWTHLVGRTYIMACTLHRCECPGGREKSLGKPRLDYRRPSCCS